jgi:uncharacterized membrane protein
MEGKKMKHLQRFVLGLVLAAGVALALVVGKILFMIASFVPGLPIVLSFAYFYALGYGVEYAYTSKVLEKINNLIALKVTESLRSLIERINPFKDKK